MERRTLIEEHYLRPGEAFHFARRTLEPGPIRILHDHDYFELFWVESGRLIHRVNGEDIVLGIGEGALIRPRDLHGFSPLGVGPCRLVNVMFRGETATHLLQRYESDMANRHFWSSGSTPQAFQLDTALQTVLDHWANDLDAGTRSLARIEGFLLGFLNHLVPATTDARSELPTWLVTAIEAARRPEVFRRGAKGLIEEANRSHEHVCRSLRVLLGTTPSALINQIRMDHAARMLSGTDMPVAAIAADCGIDNMSHFHALFRRQFGLTPWRYRFTHQRNPVQPKGDASPTDDQLAQ